eukprot:gene2930-3651_t
MQIFIKESSTNNEGSWYLIELQGHLEHSLPLQNEILGELTKKPDTKDEFQIIIGNMQLDGKEIPLKKPLLVIKKDKSSPTTTIISNDENDKNNINNNNNNVEYQIEGIVYSKISFVSRPTTIIQKSSVQFGKPQHKSPSNSPARQSPTSSPTTTSPPMTATPSSPIPPPIFK